MGILGNLLGSLAGQFTGGGIKGQITQALIKQAMGGDKGVGGLLDQFQQNGMGDIVNSWLGSGQNQSVSAEQVEKGLGNDFIRSLASDANADEATVSNELTNILPDLIDKLSPDGQIPTNLDMGTITSVLGKLMK